MRFATWFVTYVFLKSGFSGIVEKLFVPFSRIQNTTKEGQAKPNEPNEKNLVKTRLARSGSFEFGKRGACFHFRRLTGPTTAGK